MSNEKIYEAVQAVFVRVYGQHLDRDDMNAMLFIAGMEYAAAYMDTRFFDCSAYAKAIRTLADGEEPCEDCGYPLPTHDPSCVSRNL